VPILHLHSQFQPPTMMMIRRHRPSRTWKRGWLQHCPGLWSSNFPKPTQAQAQLVVAGTEVCKPVLSQ